MQRALVVTAMQHDVVGGLLGNPAAKETISPIAALAAAALA